MCNLEGLKKAAETPAKGNHARLRKQSSVAAGYAAYAAGDSEPAISARISSGNANCRCRSRQRVRLFVFPLFCRSSFVSLLFCRYCGKAVTTTAEKRHVPTLANCAFAWPRLAIL